MSQPFADITTRVLLRTSTTPAKKANEQQQERPAALCCCQSGCCESPVSDEPNRLHRRPLEGSLCAAGHSEVPGTTAGLSAAAFFSTASCTKELEYTGRNISYHNHLHSNLHDISVCCVLLKPTTGRFLFVIAFSWPALGCVVSLPVEPFFFLPSFFLPFCLSSTAHRIASTLGYLAFETSAEYPPLLKLLLSRKQSLETPSPHSASRPRNLTPEFSLSL